MVRSGVNVFACHKPIEGLEQSCFELAASIRDNGFRRAQAGDLMCVDVGGDCVGRDVPERRRFWPSREAIYHCQHVREALRGYQWAHQVDVHMVEPLIRSLESFGWYAYVSAYL